MPVQKIVIEDRRFLALIFPDIARDKVRFLFAHNSQLKAIAYMWIGGDGSFYLNARLPLADRVFRSKAVADGVGGFAEMNVPLSKHSSEIKKGERKVSYHSSGRVKGFGSFDKSVNLRDLTERRLIQASQYTKPERYQTIDNPHLRMTDIIIPSWDGGVFELSDSKPLVCRVFVEPLKDSRTQLGVLERPGDPQQSVLVFPATGLVDREGNPIQDLTYQLYFFNEDLGNNPNWTFTSFQKV